MFPLCHLKHHFCAFCGQIMTRSSAFSHWLHVFICLQLNWPALSFTSQKTFFLNYSIFFLLHYNKSLFLVKLRCFQVYHNKTFFHLFVTKFSRLSFEKKALKKVFLANQAEFGFISLRTKFLWFFKPNYAILSRLQRFFAFFKRNRAGFSLMTPKNKFLVLFHHFNFFKELR